MHGQTYNYLLANLATLVAAIPPYPNPISSRRYGHALPLLLHPHPPPIFAIASGSALSPTFISPLSILNV
jgi:hypothetical protein